MIEILVNQALALIGYKKQIGNIYEGTAAATAALILWGQTRDEVFVNLKPEWAKKSRTLVLEKTAPDYLDGANWGNTNPILNWKYQYEKPGDCLIPIAVAQVPSSAYLVWRPSPIRFQELASSILTNINPAILIYTTIVTDPYVWKPDFTAVFIRALAQNLQAVLTPERKERDDSDRRSEQGAG